MEKDLESNPHSINRYGEFSRNFIQIYIYFSYLLTELSQSFLLLSSIFDHRIWRAKN